MRNVVSLYLSKLWLKLWICIINSLINLNIKCKLHLKNKRWKNGTTFKVIKSHIYFFYIYIFLVSFLNKSLLTLLKSARCKQNAYLPLVKYTVVSFTKSPKTTSVKSWCDFITCAFTFRPMNLQEKCPLRSTLTGLLCLSEIWRSDRHSLT